jgi:hypothetical protein
MQKGREMHHARAKNKTGLVFSRSLKLFGDEIESLNMGSINYPFQKQPLVIAAASSTTFSLPLLGSA